MKTKNVKNVEQTRCLKNCQNMLNVKPMSRIISLYRPIYLTRHEFYLFLVLPQLQAAKFQFYTV